MAEKWSNYAASDAGRLEYALADITALRAELTRALDAASEARAEVVRLRGLCGKIRCVVGKEGTEDSILEAVQAIRADLRAAVDALRPFSRVWQNRPPYDVTNPYRVSCEVGEAGAWGGAAAIVAAYDAKHPEVKRG